MTTAKEARESATQERTFARGQVGELGRRITAIADQIGSVKLLAEMVGVTPQSIYNWQAGRNEPSCAQLKRIAHIGGVTVDFLLSDKKDEEQERLFVIVRDMLSDVATYDASKNEELAEAIFGWMKLEVRYRRPKGC